MKATAKKLKTAINKNATKRTKTTSTRSLKAIMKAIDFNVFRYRQKTWIQVFWKRWWKQDQKQFQDCTIVEMPQGYTLFVFNIDQFLDKENWKYPLYLVGPNGKEQPLNLKVPYPNNFDISLLGSLAKEVLSDLGIQPKTYTTGKEEKYEANKKGYAAFIVKDWEIYPLRKTKYEGIKIKWSPSKKLIYRETRDWNLEDSFIKVVWAYILATVVDENNKPLIEMDIEPRNYVPKKENSESNDNEKKEKIDLDLSEDVFEEDSSDFDSFEKRNEWLNWLWDWEYEYKCSKCGWVGLWGDSWIECRECENELEFWIDNIWTLEIKEIVNSDDLDASKEYCEENWLEFEYNWKTWVMKFIWRQEDLKKVEELFE